MQMNNMNTNQGFNPQAQVQQTISQAPPGMISPQGAATLMNNVAPVQQQQQPMQAQPEKKYAKGTVLEVNPVLMVGSNVQRRGTNSRGDEWVLWKVKVQLEHGTMTSSYFQVQGKPLPALNQYINYCYVESQNPQSEDPKSTYKKMLWFKIEDNPAAQPMNQPVVLDKAKLVDFYNQLQQYAERPFDKNDYVGMAMITFANDLRVKDIVESIGQVFDEMNQQQAMNAQQRV